jgi:putative hydrolase of the HAD superfamily
MIRTIVLDIGNVLAHFGWKEFFRDRGYDEDTYQRLCKATVQNKLWKEWDRGSREEAELIELCIRQEPGLEKELRDFFDHLLTMVKEYDYTNGFVKQLKDNGYKVYLLSNYGRWHFENDSKNFSFIPYVDGAIISYTIKRIKPEAENYEALIKKYDINPSEAVFLDDVQENLEGAIPFGFQTILFKNYAQALEELRKLGVHI